MTGSGSGLKRRHPAFNFRSHRGPNVCPHGQRGSRPPPLQPGSGIVTAEHPGMVVMKTALGSTGVVDTLPGDQLPRIC